MKRCAWVVLLVAACGKEREPPKRAPITPPVEELDRLPLPPTTPPPPAARPQPSVDQILACFSDPLRTEVPQSMSSLTTGDFDRDGRIDVVVTYETLQDEVFTGHVATYRNIGDGRLREHASVTAGDMVYAVSSGDIDHDGNLDLA